MELTRNCFATCSKQPLTKTVGGLGGHIAGAEPGHLVVFGNARSCFFSSATSPISFHANSEACTLWIMTLVRLRCKIDFTSCSLDRLNQRRFDECVTYFPLTRYYASNAMYHSRSRVELVHYTSHMSAWRNVFSIHWNCEIPAGGQACCASLLYIKAAFDDIRAWFELFFEKFL